MTGPRTHERPVVGFIGLGDQGYLNRKGYTVGHRHLGDDQSEAVAEQYRTEHTWLHHGPTIPAPSADPRKEQRS